MIPPRRSVKDVVPYAVPPEGRRGRVRLDFNENTAGFPDLLELPADLATSYPEYEGFLRALGAHLELPEDHLLLTNGSDDALSVLAATFVEPGEDAALCSRPTYALIPYFLALYGARLVEVAARPDLELDVAGIRDALAGTRIKLAVFASPDNPSGALLDPELVLELSASHPETLFAVDEAYVEYTEQRSLLPEVRRRPNLLVVRTFSKAWGLAGLRLGFIAGQPELLGWLRRVRLPFAVNTFAVEAVQRLLPEAARVRADARATMSRKAALVSALRARGFEVHDGAAHFFLLRVGREARAFLAHCRERGVLLRDRSQGPATPEMVRVTTGTDAENHAFLRALDDFFAVCRP